MSTPAKPQNPDLDQLSKVRVVVRVRPFLSQEISARNYNSVPCVSVLEYGQEVTVHIKDHQSSRNECYKLDSFFGQDDNNLSRIFDKEVGPMIAGLFRGYNATVFAYGATGSGKTYTMQGTEHIPGLIPLAMSSVLLLSQGTGSSIEVSYYEVYLDKCYDLMEVKAHETPVLEDKEGNIHLKGLALISVNTMSEFLEVFSCGNQRRKVAHTALNDVSSRSHAVLSVTISTLCDNGSGIVIGKLNLIDLAGNEDNRRTCNEGIRLQESAKINQSLFTLSNVIYALNNNKLRVPYRESKLTRILQDSLGETSRALMVACLNPGLYQESVHTVSLAARSRHISNFLPSSQKTTTPTVKVDMEAKLCAWLESKGKTKKTKAFGSPFLCQTPCSMSSAVKPSVLHSSTKHKPNAYKWPSSLKGRNTELSCRNLFDNEVIADPSVKSLDRPSQENREITSANTDVTSEENEKASTVFIQDTLLPQKTNTPAKLMNTPVKRAVIYEDNYDETSPVCEETKTLQSSTRKVLLIYEDNYEETSPVCEETKTLQSSTRKVLSPINSNIDNMSLRDQSCVALLDTKTPKTPFPIGCAGDNSIKIGTPLDKFSVMSSNLKNSLIKEYVDVLNKASREELMELKGIGQKMSEYIVELRDTSPLESLRDLEKIGLSSKQVHNMFSRTTRGIFN